MRRISPIAIVIGLAGALAVRWAVHVVGEAQASLAPLQSGSLAEDTLGMIAANVSALAAAAFAGAAGAYWQRDPALNGALAWGIATLLFMTGLATGGGL